MVLDRSISKGIVLLAVSAVSFVLGMGISGKVGIPTLGVLLMAWLAPHSNAISLGGAIALQVAIDFVFWFAVIFAILWGVDKQRQKLSERKTRN